VHRKLIPSALLLSLGACAVPTTSTTPPAGSPEQPAPARAPDPAPAPAHTTKKPTAPKTTNPPKVSKAKHAGSNDPRFGTQYALLKAGKLSTAQIIYDLVYWYDGKQAVKACKEDGERPSENDYCTGWYYRNNNPKLRTLTLDPDAPIRIDDERVSLRTFLRDIPWDAVIKFDVDGGRIMKLERVYLP
jgi:hypothetical protein